MAKRLYSEVVSGSGSSEDEQYDGRPTGYPHLHWLSKYQTEDEAEALQRICNESKQGNLNLLPYLNLEERVRILF